MEIANLAGGGKNSLLDSKNELDIRTDEVLFLKLAKNELNSFLPFHIPPYTKFINKENFSSMYGILQLSYVYDSGHKLTDDEIKAFAYGDIGQKLYLKVIFRLI